MVLLLGGRNGRITQNALDLQKIVETKFTPFATIATLLVTAEGTIEIKAVIDGHPSCPNLAGNGPFLVEIRARHVAGQTIFGIVGDRNGLLDVVVTENADDRSKNFFTGDGHVVADIGENGRLYKITRCQSIRTTGSTCNQRRTFIDTFLNQSLDLVELHF